MTSELGSAKRSSIVSRLFSISGVRRIIHTGLPRHSTVICCPNSNLEISARAGAPAARALALGFQEATKGTATPTAPTAPATDVAPTRKRRRPRSEERRVGKECRARWSPQQLKKEEVLARL